MFDFLKKKISAWLGKDKPAKKEKKTAKTKPAKKDKAKKEKPAKIEKKAKEKTLPPTTLAEKIEAEAQELAQDLPSPTKEATEEAVEEVLEEEPEIVQEESKEAVIEEAEAEEKKEEPEEKQGFFARLVKKITSGTKLAQEDFEEIFMELELTLLENNVALEAVDAIKANLSKALVGQQMKKQEAEKKILEALKESILALLIDSPDLLQQIKNHQGIYTIIFFGINGTGKTTSIAKLAHLLKKNNISVVLAAADTFRAASIEQLKTHADRLQVPLVAHQYGSDPAAVAFDAKKYAQSHDIKVVLIDTAGRMYTKENLLKEMEKIIRVSQPNLKIFVGESITGNDAIDQAKTFSDVIGIDGIILSKADVDEKAGTILSVSHVTGKPIYFLGTGQNYEDLEPFKKKNVLRHLGLD